MAAWPKGAHQHVVKAGKIGEKQRWRCRDGGYLWTRTTPRGRPQWQKSLPRRVSLLARRLDERAWEEVRRACQLRVAMDPALCHHPRAKAHPDRPSRRAGVG